MKANRFTVVILGLLALLVIHQPGGSWLAGSPVPGEGLHVLYVEDRPARSELPAGQFDTMMSSEVMGLIKEAGGKRYLLDQKQVPPDAWSAAAMKVPRRSLPWVVVDRDGRGWAGPMHGSLEEHKAFLKPYLAK